MNETIEPLIQDLLEWIGPSGRPYDDVLEAWKTSCPRLPVWEEANDRGLIRRRRTTHSTTTVELTSSGRARVATRHEPG